MPWNYQAPVFIIMENIFCTYFFWEAGWLDRFGSDLMIRISVQTTIQSFHRFRRRPDLKRNDEGTMVPCFPDVSRRFPVFLVLLSASDWWIKLKFWHFTIESCETTMNYQLPSVEKVKGRWCLQNTWNTLTFSGGWNFIFQFVETISFDRNHSVVSSGIFR